MAWPKGKPRPPQRRDLIGMVFGRLRVIDAASNRGDGRAYWNCECACGRMTVVCSHDLTSGHSRSCGCFSIETSREKATTHGMAYTRTHTTWLAMHARCKNKNLKSFKDYGGRGITVCDRWASFENFHADMGDRPEGKSIDRIDVNGSYEPGNCRWANASEQRRNQRSREDLRRAAAALGGRE